MKKSSPDNTGDSGNAPPSPLSWLDTPDDEWLDLVRDAERPREGGKIGSFVVLDELRQGGQGLVFRARHESTGTVVALKRMAAGSLATPAMRRRFEREIEMIATLDHPGIVHTSGVELVDDVPLLVMEWVEGRTLDEWADEHFRETGEARRLLTLFLQICEAVQHAHNHGVIHRDLKASNILIDQHGRSRLLDFGLARRSPLAEEDATRTLGFVGTPAYAAPEHFTDETAPIDVKSDVYSLGVVLYELVAGRRPFQKERLHELIGEIEESEAPPLLTRSGQFNRELDTIVRKAMAKKPSQRYPTAHALAEDVQRFLDGRPIEALPQRSAYVLAKWVKRHRLASGLAALLILSIIGSAALGFWQASLISKERDSVREQKQLVDDALELAREETRKAREIHRFYVDTVVEAGAPFSPVGSKDVGDILVYAGEIAPEHFAAYPHVAVEVLGSLAESLIALNRIQEAQALVQRGLAMQSDLPDADPVETAALMVSDGECSFFLGHYEEGVARLERAIELYRSLESPPPADLAIALHSLGGVEKRLGNFERAKAHLLAASEYTGEGVSAEARLMVQSQLGEVLAQLGEYEEAEPMLLEALSEAEAMYEPENIVIGNLCGSLAELYFLDGKAEPSIAYQRRSLKSSLRNYGGEHAYVAWEYFYLGRSLRLAGDLEAAFEEFERVLQENRDPQAVLAARRGQADCLARMGELDWAAEAYESLCNELAGMPSVLPTTHTEALIDWQAVLLQGERPDEARAVGERIVKRLSEGAVTRPVSDEMLRVLRETATALGTSTAIEEALGTSKQSE